MRGYLALIHKMASLSPMAIGGNVGLPPDIDGVPIMSKDEDGETDKTNSISDAKWREEFFKIPPGLPPKSPLGR